MKIIINPTISNEGYWITAYNHSVYNTNIRLGLEEISDSINNRIEYLQKEIKELHSQKEEVDQELNSRGGKYRPRRVAMPKSDVWFAECASCKQTNSNLNMAAMEVQIGVIKTYCYSCHHKRFPNNE
jgi:hypothetical protein